MLISIMQANATALMMAIYHGLSGVVEALLRAKPDVNITATGVRLPHLSIFDPQYSSTMYNCEIIATLLVGVVWLIHIHT